MIIEQTLVTRLLRTYYNECMFVLEMLENEEVSIPEAEALLIDLDLEFAEKIVEAVV